MAEGADAVPPQGDAVVVANVHDRTVTYSFYHSMMELMHNDAHNHQRVWRAGYIDMSYSTDGLAESRNTAVVKFLEEKRADWLLWIDTDMGFPPDLLERLMADADSVERPIVGALAFTWRHQTADQMGGWRCLATPTLFDWGHGDDGEMGFIVRTDYHLNAVQQVAGTGMACVLIHKSVFEAIIEKYKPLGQMWYDRVPNPGMGKVISEDLSFCMRANTVGKTVWVDTSIKTTHMKTLWVGEDDYFNQRILEEFHANRAKSVPPATEPTAIIVPVLGRPQNAAPFMESLKAAGYGHSSDQPLVKVYAVCDEIEDTKVIGAWDDAGAEIIWASIWESGPFLDGEAFQDERPGTFAEKVNLGYQATDEPWLFLVGDDVRFQPGWLDHAQHASRDGAHVIGTNDLKNPRVISGEHATHLLIRRNYIDERGASWDGPKVVAHEGYHHNFPDDEIVTVAKQRGVWAFAQHSKVEHLHPLWNDNIEIDDTYKLGASFYEQDRALFEERQAEHAQ